MLSFWKDKGFWNKLKYQLFFKHLPIFLQVFKAPTNNNNVNNNNNNNNNLTSLVNLQKKMLQEAKITEERNSNGENDPEHLSEEDRVEIRKPETMIVSRLICPNFLRELN